ncbi:hypothetical protein LTR85_011614 [Meristemomyces frigidus]|nr:hypothetical protein LTR85_011614 [Meristemomyces frigidus]
MPLPGDQHRDTPATTNPFLDTRPKVSEYTAQEIATLQCRLERQLGPEYISTRPGAGGGKVHYLAAEKVINLANEVFGFNGWSSAIQNVQIDFVDENASNGKITLGLSTIVRVSLRDGTFHEDIGYGHIENCKGKAAAFEKAKKEAATDALKRALRNFGNVLGNCLYDKDYLQKVTKVKSGPSRWDAENLHRHPDFAPVKKESIADAEARHEKSVAAQRRSSAQSGASFGSAEFEDDFGGSLLNEEDFTHPDEVRLDDSTVSAIESPAHRAINGPPQHGAQGKTGVQRMHSMPHLRPPNVQPPALVQNLQAPQRPTAVQRPSNGAAAPPPNRMLPPPQQNGALQQRPQQANGPQQAQNSMQRPPQVNGAPQAQGMPQQRPQQSNAGPGQQQQTQSDNNGPRSNPSSASTVADSPASNGNATNGNTVQNADGQLMDEHGLPIPRMPPADAPVGFVTGRSVDMLSKPPEARGSHASIAFNPHADSPSIRRTQGVNPGKSAPISRAVLNGNAQAPQSPAANGATTPVRSAANFVNPSADMNRRIGAPPGGVANRGQYRPPTAVGVKRPALADVSNMANAQGMDGASDAKKAKIEPAGRTGGGDQNTVGAAAAEAS